MVEVVAYERARDAHRLRLGGLDWDVIATSTGYADGRIARLAVHAHLQKAAIEQAPEQRKHDLQLELDRLDRLQAAYWDAALDGDVHAAALVLKISAQRSDLLGFDRTDDLMAKPEVIVIGGTPEEYTAGLRAVVEREQQEKARAAAGQSSGQ